MELGILKNESIGSHIINLIIEMASDLNKTHILDAIDIFGTSDKDGSIILTCEWSANSGQEEALDFFNKIKSIIVKSGKEVKEQESPRIIKFNNHFMITYRFRLWDIDGKYEYNEKLLVNN